jgi:transcription initiation factor TFIIIB Brf1 subunit/transcription initiation factor TFIIB
MFAAIWEDVNTLLETKRQEEAQQTTTNNYECAECKGTKVIAPEGLPVCTECGLVDDKYISDVAEWTSGVSEDGKVSDPARCGADAHGNPNLYSSQWGKSTVISTSRGSSTYKNRRMATINFHMAMNHKDRGLYHAYKEIEEACSTLPEVVVRDAKMIYKTFSERKLTRGAVRLGIKANCVLYACRLASYPRTTKEIADMFNVQTKDISRTSEMFKNVLLTTNEDSGTTRPVDVMNRLINGFEVSREHRIACNKMCRDIEECVELMSKTPNSIASAIIWIVTGIPKADVCKQCSVSVPTLNKIETIVRKYLEAKAV